MALLASDADSSPARGQAITHDRYLLIRLPARIQTGVLAVPNLNSAPVAGIGDLLFVGLWPAMGCCLDPWREVETASSWEQEIVIVRPTISVSAAPKKFEFAIAGEAGPAGKR